MRFDIITIFPEMFVNIFAGGVVQKALHKGLLEVIVHNLRDFTNDKHLQVDDRPYGGEEGMVFKPEPVYAAVEAVRTSPGAPVYLLSPPGPPVRRPPGRGDGRPRTGHPRLRPLRGRGRACGRKSGR